MIRSAGESLKLSVRLNYVCVCPMKDLRPVQGYSLEIRDQHWVLSG